MEQLNPIDVNTVNILVPYHHGDLPRALIRAVREELADLGGPGQVTLRGVARRAGVSNAAPYRHFPGLDALLDATAAEIFHELADDLQNAADAADGPIGALHGVGLSYVRFVLSRPAEARLVFRQPKAARQHDSPVGIAGMRAWQVMLDVIEAGQQAGVLRAADPEAGARAAWAGLHGVATLLAAGQYPGQSGADPERDWPTAVREQLDMLLAGLAAGPPARRDQPEVISAS